MAIFEMGVITMRFLALSATFTLCLVGLATASDVVFNFSPGDFTLLNANASLNFDEGTGNIYIEYDGNYDDLIAFCPIPEMEDRGTVKTIEIEASSIGNATADAFADIVYATSAQSTGLGATYRVTGRADASNCPLLNSTKRASANVDGSGGHTVVGGRNYFLVIGANGTSGGASGVQIHGVNLTVEPTVTDVTLEFMQLSTAGTIVTEEEAAMRTGLAYAAAVTEQEYREGPGGSETMRLRFLVSSQDSIVKPRIIWTDPTQHSAIINQSQIQEVSRTANEVAYDVMLPLSTNVHFAPGRHLFELKNGTGSSAKETKIFVMLNRGSGGSVVGPPNYRSFQHRNYTDIFLSTPTGAQVTPEAVMVVTPWANSNRGPRMREHPAATYRADHSQITRMNDGWWRIPLVMDNRKWARSLEVRVQIDRGTVVNGEPADVPETVSWQIINTDYSSSEPTPAP